MTARADLISSGEILPQPSIDAKGRYSAQLEVRGQSLRCNGQGLCEWGILGIDLYTAALYSERPIASLADALDPPQPLLIHLQFVRRLTAAQLREAFTAATKANAGTELDSYQGALDQLNATMRDVGKGDTYSFYCLPRQGLLVARNGEVLATILDDTFRRMFVQLYLGDKPPTKALRNGLLGGA